MPDNRAFIPGEPWGSSEPLARYLPRLDRGIVQTWLKDNIPAGNWVIDPFGATPRLAIEAAQAGYRVLVAANNPITRFLLEMAASAPSREEFQAGLSDLAAARKGKERLEPHILSIYATKCDHCDREIYAEAFLWKRDATGPYARIYACPHCEHSGEFPTTPADIERAAKYTSSSLHRARALERIAAQNSPERVYAEEALDVYPPRAMYVLSTLINKLEGLSVSPERLQTLSALLLSTFDRANTLWPHPSERARPRQLTIPSHYRENNIWYALENAVLEWSGNDEGVAVSHWPEAISEEAGISIFEGRMRDLVETLGQVEISAVISAFPRPNQAYWTLSALWTGWLWGQEGLGRFAGVLRRRRYEWAWHTNALQKAMSRLAASLREDTPFLGLITESEAGFDAAAMIAVKLAGFEIKNVAVRPASRQTQLQCAKRATKTGKETTKDNQELVQEAAQELLINFGQPADYLHLQAIAYSRLAQGDRLRNLGAAPAEVYSESRSILEFGLTFQSGFKRYGGSESSLEGGQWWLKEEGEFTLPLSDRVEKQLVNFLFKNPGSSFHKIETAMCSAFPGFLTPEHALIQSTLSSYGKELAGAWQIRMADNPEARRVDIKEIQNSLTKIGDQLDYKVVDGKPLIWENAEGNLILCFYIIASGVLGDIVLQADDGQKSYIVLPGGRTSLVLHKLEYDARLKEAIGTGWQFLKFRHVRRLAENPTLTRDSIEELFGLDMIKKDDPQIPLL
jgi:hypothetical protein